MIDPTELCEGVFNQVEYPRGVAARTIETS